MRLTTILGAVVTITVALFIALYAIGFRLEVSYIPWLISATTITVTISTTTITVNREKRRQKEYSAINRLVDKDQLETEVKQLSHKREREELEVSSLENQLKEGRERIEALEEFIRRDLPREARTAATKIMMEERIIEQEKELGKLFEEWKEAKASVPTAKAELPPDLANTIEKAIEPKYVIERRIENAKSALALMTTIFAIVTVVFPQLPDPFSSALKFALLIPIIILVAYLVQNYRKNVKLSPDMRAISNILEVIGLTAVFIFSSIGILFGLILLLIPNTYNMLIPGLLLLCPSIAGALLSAFGLWRSKMWR